MIVSPNQALIPPLVSDEELPIPGSTSETGDGSNREQSPGVSVGVGVGKVGAWWPKHGYVHNFSRSTFSDQINS